MPSFSEFSTTPASNTTIGGLSSAEDCAAGNMNDITRYLAACGRSLYDTVAAINVSNYLPLAGGTVIGNITRSGSGVHRYNADATLTSGRTYFLPTGSARPSPAAEGDVIFYY